MLNVLPPSRASSAPTGLCGGFSAHDFFQHANAQPPSPQPTPRGFTYFIGDAHVYENHLDMLNEQLKREPFPMPKLVISDRVPEFAKTGEYQPEWLELIEPGDFSLEGYEHHAPMTAPMAV